MRGEDTPRARAAAHLTADMMIRIRLYLESLEKK